MRVKYLNDLTDKNRNLNPNKKKKFNKSYNKK